MTFETNNNFLQYRIKNQVGADVSKKFLMLFKAVNDDLPLSLTVHQVAETIDRK